MLISYACCRVIDNIAALPTGGAGGFDCSRQLECGLGGRNPDGPGRRRPVSVLTGVISKIISGMNAGQLDRQNWA
jgi:hypothetical protein